MELRQAALGILVRCLHFALEGKKWVGITWGIFSVVHALRNLSENMANKRVLTSRGLVQLLGVGNASPPRRCRVVWHMPTCRLSSCAVSPHPDLQQLVPSV